jgi:SAM-dependent methyltransferase
MTENTYTGPHAAHYDLIYADKPYAGEARFIDGLLPKRGTLLDVACGTGRHAIEFAGLGYDVTGIDYSAELLERARENAAQAGVEIQFLLQDMRTLDLGERFDVVTCLFDSIGYPLTDEGIVGALTRIHEHLEPDGTLAVEFLHAPMLRLASPVKVGRWDTPDGRKLLRISETELDLPRRVMTVSYELLELDPNTCGYRTFTECQANRFFSPEEMRELLAAADLEVTRFAPAYAEGEVTAETWHVLALARP